LDLQGCGIATVAEGRLVAAAIAAVATSVATVDLAGNPGLGNRAVLEPILSAAAAAPAVKHLSLRDCRLGAAAGQLLLEHADHRFESLDLRGSPSIGIAHQAVMLEWGLATAGGGTNDIDSSGGKSDGRSPGLATAVNSVNRAGGDRAAPVPMHVQTDHMATILGATDGTLTSIAFSDVKLAGAADAQYVANILGGACRVVSVSLSGCTGLDMDGVLAPILKAMVSEPDLAAVDLSATDISPAGWEQVAEAISECRSITKLNLASNASLTQEARAKFEAWQQQANRTLRSAGGGVTVMFAAASSSAGGKKSSAKKKGGRGRRK
jgi:hypothetical protein